MNKHIAASAAAEWALAKVGCPYSQEKRGQKGVFDCSSLVARAYAAQGKRWRYGGRLPRSNQEVYDDDFELLWPENYSDIGKRLGGADVLERAKQPGDLQFLCTDSKTSRSNRITHVAMVADEKRIVHARGKAYGVCVNRLSHYAGKVCAVVRYNPDGMLRAGMKGERTLALQQKLNTLGADLKADGEYGEATTGAVKAFQQSRGLPVTGEADRSVLEALALRNAEGTLVRITGDTVNVRLGPGTAYESVSIARRGDTFPAVNAAGWQPILLGGEIRWVSTKYASLEQAAEEKENFQ